MADKEQLVAIPAGFADDVTVAPLRRYGHDVRGLRDLLVQMQCYIRRTGSADAFVPEEQVAVLVLPDSARVARRDAGRLADAGVIIKVDGGYRVPMYSRGNGARAEAKRAAQSEGARRANHDRWHLKRGEQDPDCPFCQFTDQYTGTSTHRSPDQCSEASIDRSTDRFMDQSTDQLPSQSTDRTDNRGDAEVFNYPPVFPTETLTPPGCLIHVSGADPGCLACAGGDAESPADLPPPRFEEFWQAYPRKVGKPRAIKAFRAAMRRKDDPDLIISAALAYRNDPSRSADYTAHPSTWLNDQRYNDGAGKAESAPAAHDPWEAPWRN